MIKDSGDRTEFETGAVRDMREGKGRCDLLPLDVVGELMNDGLFTFVEEFKYSGKEFWLLEVLRMYSKKSNFQDVPTMILEVSKHFEEGAKKYGENNWQKGIPVKSYLDSAVRHYLKHLRGDLDEPHNLAFCWNILCAIWTCQNKPELNNYRKDDSNASN